MTGTGRRPGLWTVLRDIIIFVIGAGIVIQQTGFPFLLDSPEGGLSIPALITGAIFCNGPVVLQALPMLFGGGTSTSGRSPEQPPSASPLAPSSEPSSGAE